GVCSTANEYHLGGALKISGVANITNSIFQGNTAKGIVDTTYDGSAGAIYAGTSSKISIKNTKFLQNEADAIGAVGIFKEASLENVVFEKNKATSATGDGGGALFFGAVADATVNSVSNSSFKENESASRGGAISTRAFAQGDNHAAKLDIINAVFERNVAATNGGAIDNYFYHSDANADGVTIDNSTFTLNKAKNGGAIYNHIGQDGDNLVGGEKQVGSMYINNSSFTGNAATYGAAIYNDGIINVSKSIFDNNSSYSGAIHNTGIMTIADSYVQNNYGNWYTGGIFNGGDITIDNTIITNNLFDDYSASGAFYMKSETGNQSKILNSYFEGNKALYRNIITDPQHFGAGGALGLGIGNLLVDNTEFKLNQADAGGAIYVFLNTKGTNTLTLQNSKFDGNFADAQGGALSNMETANISNTVFTNNYTTNDDNDGGGAIFLGAQSITKIDNTVFSGNASATFGGAIATRTSQAGSNIGARVDITDSKFIGNTAATDGGAIDNYFMSSVSNPSAASIINTEFSGNSANNGGAIYNHITDIAGHKVAMTIENSSFTGNVATEKGGAIYNEGILALTGNNVFSNNKANGVLNDIYNVGTISIADNLTLDGGITGNGIVNFTGDTDLVARLQKDSATISGKTISGLDNVTIAGLVVENGLADAEYRLAGAEDAIEKQFFEITATNALYDFELGTANGSVKLTRKSVAEQTAGLEKAGLDSSAAKTIAAISGVKSTGIANADALFADLTAAAQSGDAGAAAAINEVAKTINPESESVAQSAALSVQSMINDLTVERMDMGRAGGDVELTSGGVWAYGLYNKSKNGDKFSGHTRGVAVGIDETINKDIMLGIGYAFGHSDVTAQTRDTDIDSHSVFLYGQYKPSEWYANATLNYTISKYNEDGLAAFVPVNAEYRADAFGANVATGYDFASGITPELGLRYLRVRSTDYTNNLGMNVDLDSTDFLTGSLGVRYGFDITASDAFLIRPELNAAAKYDMLSDKNVATVALPGINAYTLDGERLNRFGGEFGAGLTMSYYGFDLQLLYSIDVRKDYTSQTGMAKFRYNF
ncbi:MAG: autotransporter domain-containing protein, partial [Proteobacteria bacterium]|nr:autotransporter domain-containing protein [Candidatus Enterousia scatequi]